MEETNLTSGKGLGIVALVAVIVCYVVQHGMLNGFGFKGPKDGTFKKDGVTPNTAQSPGGME